VAIKARNTPVYALRIDVEEIEERTGE